MKNEYLSDILFIPFLFFFYSFFTDTGILTRYMVMVAHFFLLIFVSIFLKKNKNGNKKE